MKPSGCFSIHDRAKTCVAPGIRLRTLSTSKIPSCRAACLPRRLIQTTKSRKLQRVKAVLDRKPPNLCAAACALGSIGFIPRDGSLSASREKMGRSVGRLSLGSRPATREPSIVVAIPVKNEADRVGRCLFALATQTRPPNTVVLLLNNCTDETEAIVRFLEPQLPYPIDTRCLSFPPSTANAGEASIGHATCRWLCGPQRHPHDDGW